LLQRFDVVTNLSVSKVDPPTACTETESGADISGTANSNWNEIGQFEIGRFLHLKSKSEISNWTIRKAEQRPVPTDRPI
jgi:hypothetical protein